MYCQWIEWFHNVNLKLIPIMPYNSYDMNHVHVHSIEYILQNICSAYRYCSCWKLHFVCDLLNVFILQTKKKNPHEDLSWDKIYANKQNCLNMTFLNICDIKFFGNDASYIQNNKHFINNMQICAKYIFIWYATHSNGNNLLHRKFHSKHCNYFCVKFCVAWTF